MHFPLTHAPIDSYSPAHEAPGIFCHNRQGGSHWRRISDRRRFPIERSGAVRRACGWPGRLLSRTRSGWTGLLTATNTGDCGGGCIPPSPGFQAVSLERFSAGYNVGGRAGYQLGPWRFEGEVNYRHNNSHGLDMVSPIHRRGRADGAERHSVSEMANLIYDFDLGWPVTPHLGGGVGAAEVTRNLSNRFGGTPFPLTTSPHKRHPKTPPPSPRLDWYKRKTIWI